MTTSTDKITPGSIPENYHQVLDWKITQSNKQLVLLNLLAIPWLAICVGIFMLWKIAWNNIRNFITTNGAVPAAGAQTFVVVNWALAILAGVAVTVVLHELIHGITMRRYGAKPKYGVLWSGLMFYATAAGFAFRRNDYLKVALAPLLVLSLIVLVVLAMPISANLATLLIICGSFNAAGAIGDLWITRVVLRYPAHAYVIDERDGVRIFMPEEP
ncbi:MAG: DUF3267 domain-containing protein [Anaerolineaceae bacterium]